jgi:predicted regulator of Ras-like GTPase activity (Roadblock/LC7/MglB family)
MTYPGQNLKSQIVRNPEVNALVVSDASGALLECTGSLDGESAAAVIAVVLRSLNGVGEQLGIGTVRRATLSGTDLVIVCAVTDDQVFGIYVDPTKPLGSFEKKLDAILGR